MAEKPTRIFNTAGTCNPLHHYMLPALPRLPDVSGLIEGQSYFVIHAPRQSGKTTCLNELTNKINSEGRYYAVKCSLAALKITEDVKEAMGGAVNLIIGGLVDSAVPMLSDLAFQFSDRPYMSMPEIKVRCLLKDLCNALDRELVVFFDEADCLHEAPLIMFLSQLRDGYLDRYQSPETRFPRSL
ncbi:MAG: ATP-binding protein, partial [Deltaproteobacteria bacterium]|nr:ATP-binding protein [Deltaproteobacteria bacterium]